MELIAKTFQGLETILATELIELGANDIQIGHRMVAFTGDKSMMYRANFSLRTALRILKPISHFTADNADDVYEQVKMIPWEEYMDIKTTFAVDANVFSPEFRHSQFVAYRVKDAIADHWRDITDGTSRPNVRLTNPDIRIDIHIAGHDVTISLDSSGESLHRRGYRQESVAAPLNEVLAAGIIRMTGWKADCDFVDPMCGSGTLPIEAALIARNIAPGVFRQDYAFMHWRDFDEALWQDIYDDDSQERDFEYHIYGYDINRNAVQIAQENVKIAGLADIVTIEQRDIADFVAVERPTVMVTNPPYGERITTDDLMGLYETIGQKLKQCFAGNNAFVLSSNKDAFDRIGLKPSTKVELLNGNIAVELRKYQMFNGRYADLRAEGRHIKTAAEKAQNARGNGRNRVFATRDADERRPRRADEGRPRRDDERRPRRDDDRRPRRDDDRRPRRDDENRQRRDDERRPRRNPDFTPSDSRRPRRNDDHHQRRNDDRRPERDDRRPRRDAGERRRSEDNKKRREEVYDRYRRMKEMRSELER